MRAPSAEIRRETIRAVITLGTPIVLSNLLTWAVGFTDIYMVSRLGETALAGLGMANQIFFLVVVLILAVTTGTMALVARFVGAGDHEMTSHVIRQSLLLAIVQSAVISVAGLIVAPTLFRFLGATPEVAVVGVLYLRILLIGIAAPVLDFTLASIFRGAGDSMTPLRITFGVVVLNIIGNYLLIFGPGPFPALGIAGAATSTVLARSVGAFWGWRKLNRAASGVRWVAGGWAPDREMMRRILRIGVPSAFEGFLRAGSGVAFLGIVARTGAGATAVAAHTVGLQLESFARLPSFAISVGATALVGQRLGANDPEGAELAGWTSVQVGGILLSALGLILYVLAPHAAALFSDDPQTIGLAVRYLRILAIAQPLFMVAVVLAGALRAGGDTRFPMWVSFYAGWAFLLPIAYYFAVTLDHGPGAAWLAQAGNYAISAILSAFRFRGGKWRTMDI